MADPAISAFLGGGRFYRWKMLTDLSAEVLMSLALEQAREAFRLGEVPVGAILVRADEIIATGYNEIELANDATAHAEIKAIQRASTKLRNWRLNETTLVVTLEPCWMCAGAIRLARIGTVIYGAKDPRFGAASTLEGITVTAGVREEECLELMQNFFKDLRAK